MTLVQRPLLDSFYTAKPATISFYNVVFFTRSLIGKDRLIRKEKEEHAYLHISVNI